MLMLFRHLFTLSDLSVTDDRKSKASKHSNPFLHIPVSIENGPTEAVRDFSSVC